MGYQIQGHLEKRIQILMAQGWSTKIIFIKKWIWTSRLLIKNSLFSPCGRCVGGPTKRGIKSSFPRTLIRAFARRNPRAGGTNQGIFQRRFAPLVAGVLGVERGGAARHRQSLRWRQPQRHAHPTPYTLHPTPYTLHPTPYTLHPTPYTLHPTPCTLHPTPYI